MSPAFTSSQNHVNGGDTMEGGGHSMAFGVSMGGCEPFQPGRFDGQDAGLWDASGVGMQVGILQAEGPTSDSQDRWESCWEWVRTGWCPRGETCRWEHPPPMQGIGFDSTLQFWSPDEACQSTAGDFAQQAAGWSMAGGPGTAPGTDFVGGGPCGSIVGGPMIAAPLHQGIMAPQGGLQLQDPGPPQGLPLQVGATTPTMEDYDGLPMTPRDGD